MRRLVLLLVAAALSIGPGLVSGAAPPTQTCPFGDGFAALYAEIGAQMGDPTTCEFPDPLGTGDVQQYTTTGLAFWRKATNTPTFTDGYQHWALTTAGLVSWYGHSVDPPADAVLVESGGPVALPPTETAADDRTPIVRFLTSDLPAIPAADISGAPKGRYRGTPEEVAVRAEDLGPGWIVERQARAQPDGATTGPLTTHFRNGSRSASTTVFVFRTRADALAAWRNIPGGSLEICEASVYGGLGDGVVDGACLIQNVAIELAGVPFTTAQAALGRAAQRVQERLAPQATPASVGPLYSGTPSNVREQLSKLGPEWELVREEQQRENEYSTGLLRSAYRKGSGSGAEMISVDVEVFRSLEMATGGFRQVTQHGGEAVDFCDAGWVSSRTFSQVSVLCRQGNVLLRVFARSSEDARAILEPMRQHVIAGTHG